MSDSPGYKRKLIEVALPLDEINKQSSREKSIRHGHPSTLHLWWARRPLAAVRAVLFAQLVDDPSAHPDKFQSAEDEALERKRLFSIIERLVNWDNINDKALYEEARKEILKSCDDNPPSILDPFAGGGSIPLEAQRLGLEAHASDLNPVPALINKALIEIPPKWSGKPPVFPGAADEQIGGWPGATGLAEDVRRYGQWMRDEARRRIGHLYPKVNLEDGTTSNVIAWIWARTIICPNPACRGVMPLVRSFWLGRKKGKERYVEPIIEGGEVRFEIRGPKGNPRSGTVGRNKAMCLICGEPVSLPYVRTEGKAGRMGIKLMAIVAEGVRRRHYLAPDEVHELAAKVSRPNNSPDGEISKNPRWFSPPLFGMAEFSDLFTNRQLTSLITLGDLVAKVRERVVVDAQTAGLPVGDRLADGGTGAAAYSDAVATYLAISVSRLTDYSSTLTTWASNPQMEILRNTFGRQAVPMTWDFAEGNIFGSSSGALEILVAAISKSIAATPARGNGRTGQIDAASRSYRGFVVATDPPYYDNIGYADLSDFFYIWLRRSLGSVFPDIFDTLLTPKDDELVANTHRRGGKEEATRFFEDGFRRVFTRIRNDAPVGFPITVFYAFKQSETDENGEASTGWETLLEGMIRAGWTVTATWPIRTERGGRLISVGTNALASSVVLACRTRPQDATVIDRRGLINALKAELPGALRDMQQGGIAPVDLAQAAIGPGMAVFSRYSRVVESDGSSMRVRAALVLINQILAEVLSEQEGDFDSDTRFCIKWFENYGFDTGKFGEAETLSKAIDTSVARLDSASLLTSRAGVVQLLSPAELPASYDPMTGDRVSVWEIVMQLAKRLDGEGIDAAASLMAAAKMRVDLDTAKELTYLLYSICERRKWAETGLLFNELGAAWPEIEKASRTSAPIGDLQGTLDYPEED